MPMAESIQLHEEKDVVNLVKHGDFKQLSAALEAAQIGQSPESDVLKTINKYLMTAYTTALEAAIAEPWGNLAKRREYLKKAGAIAFHNRMHADDKKCHIVTGALGLWERYHGLVLTVQTGESELYRHLLYQDKDLQHKLLNAPINGGKVSRLLFIAATDSQWHMVDDLIGRIYADGAKPDCSRQDAFDQIIANSSMNDGARIVLQQRLIHGAVRPATPLIAMTQ